MKTKYSIKNMVPGVEYDVPLWLLKKVPGCGGMVAHSETLLNVDMEGCYWLNSLDTKKRDFFQGGFVNYHGLDWCYHKCNPDYVINLKTKKWFIPKEIEEVEWEERKKCKNIPYTFWHRLY